MKTQVAVVGAGPTGLMLAGDLAEAGIDCTVIERRAETSNLSRAFAVHARTLEQFDARGLADELISTGQTVPGLRVFSGIDIRLDNLPTRFPFALITPQLNTELLLETRARDLGVRFEIGAEVTGLRESEEGVEVTAIRDDARLRFDANFVVGTDGVHSRVRRALGLAFPGKSAVQSVMLADVRLRERPHDVLTVDATSDGFAFIAPFGDGWYRIIAWDRHNQQPDDASLDLDQVAAITRAVLRSDYGMHDARWLSRFHSDERQVENYRVGRVFIAGDAAHVHSPAGGQGMNTGIQDATNLSWKLAAVLNSGAQPDDLLDTYQRERHPIGQEVLRTSSALLHAAMLRSAPARAARFVVGHAAQLLPPVRTRVAMTISGLGASYESAYPGGGERAGDISLASGQATRLYAALRERRFVWITPPAAGGLRIDHPDVINVEATTDNGFALVRPDGYYAMRLEQALPPPQRLVRAALQEWVAHQSHEWVRIHSTGSGAPSTAAAYQPGR